MSSQAQQPNIGIVGAGIMGQTLIRGILGAGLVGPDQIFAAVNTDTSREKLKDQLKVSISNPYRTEWLNQTDIFIICTKPHSVLPIMREWAESGKLKASALFISIAAGVTLTQMEEILPNYPIMRAMPNTPCRIGAGATVLSPGKGVEEHHLAEAERIFASVGKCYRLAEKHLNAVTAVSGSGPAYAYLIMEALADGAVKVGLPRDLAFSLVSQTMLGAAQMLQQSGRHPATLKDEVTTPSGCTISALLTMEDGKIRSTLARAVEEATRTAARLG